MQLEQSIQHTLSQLTKQLEQLTPEEFTQPSTLLFGATIGQHVRHIIELFHCLFAGYEAGVVNYSKRKRDQQIESDIDKAKELLGAIANSIQKENKDLILEFESGAGPEDPVRIATNYFRELVYNLEHTVHHMALIRVGIAEVSSVAIPQDFGVAAATVKYKKTCVQ